MKNFVKIFILICVCCFSLCSCKTEYKQYPRKTTNECINEGVGVVEITVDSITHQYLYYSVSNKHNGFCHYPECKYCKNTEK